MIWNVNTKTQEVMNSNGKGKQMGKTKYVYIFI